LLLLRICKKLWKNENKIWSWLVGCDFSSHFVFHFDPFCSLFLWLDVPWKVKKMLLFLKISFVHQKLIWALILSFVSFFLVGSCAKGYHSKEIYTCLHGQCI
jgi:hypothetical protein